MTFKFFLFSLNKWKMYVDCDVEICSIKHLKTDFVENITLKVIFSEKKPPLKMYIVKINE